ncbi:TldD/PmbA family protein [Oligoflexus tunisiensis]|uniref:TldD/PmbA family protein n=1 Tax=Oligoflexus tunisiensis TaxID=708132 RepID=UPI000AFC78C6|nr:TldD/PmbA family protein [Oligoflexus tunisiensis]
MQVSDALAVLRPLATDVDFYELRWMRRSHEQLAVRQDVVEPPRLVEDAGFMLTVYQGGAAGYAATADTSRAGVEQAFQTAKRRAELSRGWSVTHYAADPLQKQIGRYQSPIRQSWDEVPLGDRIDLLRELCRDLKRNDARFVDHQAQLHFRRWHMRLVNSVGTDIEQTFDMINPLLGVTVHDKGVTEMRSLNGHAACRQGGFEVLDHIGYRAAARQIHEEALELLYAENCPTGVMDLLLAPDQMILQIHESIGHPLEIDRILGDERNYAGTSFVRPEMFGTYQYGSEHLNVTFDPTRDHEFASYHFDDTGTRAEKTFLIKNGLLVAGLGGQLSQQRSGLPGVANARSVSWNRPAIDRMANLNIEPGPHSMDAMVHAVERGIFMQTNCSWSIDDSRNKFQFGCEYARLIENGRLGRVVRKPNYRGISANFWRNLTMVGNEGTSDILGTAYCGKGEPNQAITVGHASPACLFSAVEVFGGEG